VRRTRAQVGRRPPGESSRKHHRRARRQLGKLAEIMVQMQRAVIEQGVSSGQLETLAGALDQLDEVLEGARKSESRTRAFKRIRRAAKHARHTLAGA